MVDDAPEPMKFGDAQDAPVLALFARVRAPDLPRDLEAKVLAAVAAPPPKDPLSRLFLAHGDEAWSFLLAATGAADVARAALEDTLFRVHRRLTHRKHAGDELDGPALDGAPGQALVLNCARESAADAWDVLKKIGREPPERVGDVTPRPCPGARELLARVQERAERERAHLAGVQSLTVKIALACTFCHAALSRGEAVYCGSCLAPHHDDCFREHARCAAPGCGEKLVVRAAAPTPYHRPRRRRPFIAGLGLVAALSSAALAGHYLLRSSDRDATTELALHRAYDEALERAAAVEREAQRARELLQLAEQKTRALEEKHDLELNEVQREALRKQEKLTQALAEAESGTRRAQAQDVLAKQREIDDLRQEKNQLQDQNIELARRFDVEKQRFQQEAESIRAALAKESLRPDEMWEHLAKLARDRAVVNASGAGTVSDTELELAALWLEIEGQAGASASARDLPRLVASVDLARQRLEGARAALKPDELTEWTLRLEALEAALGRLQRRELLFAGLADLQDLELATQAETWPEAESLVTRLEGRLALAARSKSAEARASATSLQRLVTPAARGMRAERALAQTAARVERIVPAPPARPGDEGAVGPRRVVIAGQTLAPRDAVPGTTPTVVVVSIGEDEVLLATENRKRVVSVSKE